MNNSNRIIFCQNIILGVTGFIAIVGVFIGGLALLEYKHANNASMTNTLLNMDKETYIQISNRPYLQAMFVMPISNVDTKQAADRILALFLNKEHIDNKLLQWNNIPELFNRLFEYSNFNNSDKQKLREAYFIAENILYLLLNAYESKNLSILSDQDYETYIGYIAEIGHNPLFLCAIYCGHKYGFITKLFSLELKTHLLKKKETKVIIKDIYKDLLDDKWCERVGESK
jgi:hypothetical protein